MSHFVQEAAVDLVDDLQMSGQQIPKQFDWPGFQSLWQQGVAGIGECTLCNLPGAIPVKLIFIYQ